MNRKALQGLVWLWAKNNFKFYDFRDLETLNKEFKVKWGDGAGREKT